LIVAIVGRVGATPPNLERVRPYGDTLDDGQVQISFSLPVPHGPEASEAARRVAAKMGLEQPRVYHSKDLGDGYSFFIVYGRFTDSIDFTQIQVAKVESDRMDFYGVNDYVRTHIGRQVVVLGACTGTDAHSVGIDAIMNMKGYAGEYGLERYPMLNAYNLGMQVPNEELIAQAIDKSADALLVSQVVTQKDVHIRNLSELVDMLEAEGLRERLIVVAGGPRISHELALEIGLDAGFGAGTRAPDVASYIVQEIVARGLV
jgi:beta-lysine 5,6-aminomutase beta subunit